MNKAELMKIIRWMDLQPPKVICRRLWLMVEYLRNSHDGRAEGPRHSSVTIAVTWTDGDDGKRGSRWTMWVVRFLRKLEEIGAWTDSVRAVGRYVIISSDTRAVVTTVAHSLPTTFPFPSQPRSTFFFIAQGLRGGYHALGISCHLSSVQFNAHVPSALSMSRLGPWRQ
ncbi:hypothetical protein BJV74DRAFT_798076 [Russula compacta]|nr:hypothetical protein BJV74DRAFT_798076 [Russula compacta]